MRSLSDCWDYVNTLQYLIRLTLSFGRRFDRRARNLNNKLHIRFLFAFAVALIELKKFSLSNREEAPADSRHKKKMSTRMTCHQENYDENQNGRAYFS